MPNSAHKWTGEEEQDAVSLGWADFSAKHGLVISKDAYRIRRNKLLRQAGKGSRNNGPFSPDPAMAGLTAIERAVANNVKMARALIRLRHTIEADDELALAIPRIRAALDEQAANGLVTGLGYEELRRLIYGDAA